MKFYGSVNNRLEENKMYCNEIKVGTGMTEYYWSDRHAYEVVKVIDQKHIVVREYDHKHIGEAYENKWELVSNENNAEREMERRGDRWYWVSTLYAEDLNNIPNDNDGEITKLHLRLAGYDLEKVAEKGKQTKRYRANVSFGTADYYYDYEF